MAGLGSLVVTLEANMAQFTSDMGKAVNLAETAMGKVSRAVSQAQASLEALGAAYAIEKAGTFVKSVIDSTDKLEQLHIQTGLSVEALSAMQAEAVHVGTDLEFAANAFDKLQKNAFAAVSGNTKMAATFGAIGMSAKELQEGLKNPDQLLLDFAGHMQQFADDGNKTAVMMELMGKSGAEATEFIQRMAEVGYQNANATAAQAQQAREFNAAIADWNTSFNALARDVIMYWMPKLQNFVAIVKVSFAILAATASNVWATLKYDAVVAFNALSDVVMRWAKNVGDVLAEAPISGVSKFGKILQEWGSHAGENVAAAQKQWYEALRVNAGTMQEAVNDYVNTTTGALKPGAAPATQHIVPPKSAESQAALRTQLTGQLRMIQDAIKAEDDALKLGDTQLDADYDQGLISLQDYATQKQEILAKNNTATQALYDQQIADIKRILPLLKDENQQAAAKNALQQVTDAKTRDGNKYLQDRLTLQDKLIQDGKKYAQELVQLNIAYDNMMGNTADATALQIELDDALLRARLEAAGDADALAKLAAVEHDRMLHAQTDLKSGVQRAASDYAKSLQNVAKAGEDITNNMFSGMTDALVSFVQTGKLSFRSLVDDIIAGMIRIIVEQQIMKPLTDWLGGLIGGGLGALFGGVGGAGAAMAGGTDLADIGSFAGFAAAGGPTMANRSYVVGEAGPELWMPKSAGTVIPNSALGGGGIVYAPVINVDARSDRAQVQAEVERAVRDGNRQLVAQLTRYNPGLRM